MKNISNINQGLLIERDQFRRGKISLQLELTKLKGRLNRLEVQRDTLCRQLRNNGLREQEQTARLDKFSQENERLQSERDCLRQEQGCLQEEARQMYQEKSGLQEELARKDQENATLSQQIIELGKTIARQAEENEHLKREQVKLQEELARKEQEQERLEKLYNQLKQRASASRGEGSTGDPLGYFKILGINPTAAATLSEEQFALLIKGAYRAFSQAFHPDKGGNEELMKQLNLAREVLLDPKRRRAYMG